MSALEENAKRANLGLIPSLDIVKDITPKKDIDANSWYLSGSYEINGEKVNYMWHAMTVKVPVKGTIFSYRMTFTNETTGFYYDMGEKAATVGGGLLGGNKAKGCKLDNDKLNIVMPEGYIRGDFDNLEFKFETDGNAVEIRMTGEGYPLYCGGNGVFSWCGTTSHQYSIPHLKTNGTLRMDGKTYEIKNGESWFDRQWQNNNPAMLMKLMWCWMDMRLDNGDIISLWTNGYEPDEHTWATILKPDGSHTVTYCKVLSSCIKEYYVSERTGRAWPVKWEVELPDLDTKLMIDTFPYNQEIYSEGEIPGSCYEGASTVSGIYKGQPVTGHCYVEITGKWESLCKKADAVQVK